MPRYAPWLAIVPVGLIALYVSCGTPINLEDKKSVEEVIADDSNTGTDTETETDPTPTPTPTPTDDPVPTTTLANAIGTRVPAEGDIEIDLSKPVVLTFNTALDSTTVTSDKIKVYNSTTSAEIPGTLTYDPTNKTVTFTPTTEYPENTKVVVKVLEGLKLDDGTVVDTGDVQSFTTLDRSKLVAHWRFDGNGNDSSGNGHTLTATNITYDTSDKVQGSSAASFNGVDSAYDAGVFNFGTKFTVAVWVYISSPVKFDLNTILANGNGGIEQDGFKFFINEFVTTDLCVVTEAGNGTLGAKRKTSTGFVSVGSWKHLAFVMDKTAVAANRAVFYFNGVKEGQATEIYQGVGSNEFRNDFNTNAQTYIGRFVNLGANNFFYKGKMDDFRVYNTVLTDAEIAQIATQK